jgi:hypothetical protein
MQLRGDGQLVTRANGLRIAVDTCTSRFQMREGSAVCRTGATKVLASAPLSDVATRTSSSSWRLNDIVHGDPRFLLVTLSLPADAELAGSVDGLSGTFAIGLYAAGDDAPDSLTHAPLAETGLNLIGPVLMALGALGLGLVVRSRRRTEVTDA